MIYFNANPRTNSSASTWVLHPPISYSTPQKQTDEQAKKDRSNCIKTEPRPQTSRQRYRQHRSVPVVILFPIRVSVCLCLAGFFAGVDSWELGLDWAWWCFNRSIGWMVDGGWLDDVCWYFGRWGEEIGLWIGLIELDWMALTFFLYDYLLSCWFLICGETNM